MVVIAGSSQSNELKLARYFQFYHVNLYLRHKKVYDIEYWKCERGFKKKAVVFSNLNQKELPSGNTCRFSHTANHNTAAGTVHSS